MLVFFLLWTDVLAHHYKMSRYRIHFEAVIDWTVWGREFLTSLHFWLWALKCLSSRVPKGASAQCLAQCLVYGHGPLTGSLRSHALKDSWNHTHVLLLFHIVNRISSVFTHSSVWFLYLRFVKFVISLPIFLIGCWGHQREKNCHPSSN